MEKKVYDKYINNDNFIKSGKEGNTYKVFDQVIKIFHKERQSPLPRISDEGLNQLIKLSLKCFNNPIETLTDEGCIIGTVENFLEEEELTVEHIAASLDDLHEDIKTLSQYGFIIEDLFYNYMSSNGKLKFFDMTSYQYINTNVPFLLERIYKKNLDTINTFLTGYLMFGAFRKGQTNEYTKIYQATTYNKEHLKDKFFGDYVKQTKMEIESYKRRM